MKDAYYYHINAGGCTPLCSYLQVPHVCANEVGIMSTLNGDYFRHFSDTFRRRPLIKSIMILSGLESRLHAPAHVAMHGPMQHSLSCMYMYYFTQGFSLISLSASSCQLRSPCVTLHGDG